LGGALRALDGFDPRLYEPEPRGETPTETETRRQRTGSDRKVGQ
jgi:hypothetical protein